MLVLTSIFEGLFRDSSGALGSEGSRKVPTDATLSSPGEPSLVASERLLAFKVTLTSQVPTM